MTDSVSPSHGQPNPSPFISEHRRAGDKLPIADLIWHLKTLPRTASTSSKALPCLGLYDQKTVRQLAWGQLSWERLRDSIASAGSSPEASMLCRIGAEDLAEDDPADLRLPPPESSSSESLSCFELIPVPAWPVGTDA